jgi:hypothetical protein
MQKEDLMTNSDFADPKLLQQDLTHLSNKLKSLHRDLLRFQTRHVEQSDGRRYGPYDLFEMSVSDPRFAWMRKLSKMISHIDDYVSDMSNLPPFELTTIISDIHELLSGTDDDFSQFYKAALQSDPAITILEVDVKKALTKLKTHQKPLN